MFLVLLALLSVPVLLVGKPLYLYWTYRGGKGLRRCRVRALPRPEAARARSLCCSALRTCCCFASGL